MAAAGFYPYIAVKKVEPVDQEQINENGNFALALIWEVSLASYFHLMYKVCTGHSYLLEANQSRILEEK